MTHKDGVNLDPNGIPSCRTSLEFGITKTGKLSDIFREFRNFEFHKSEALKNRSFIHHFVVLLIAPPCSIISLGTDDFYLFASETQFGLLAGPTVRGNMMVWISEKGYLMMHLMKRGPIAFGLIASRYITNSRFRQAKLEKNMIVKNKTSYIT